jgi:hypothetical protein
MATAARTAAAARTTETTSAATRVAARPPPEAHSVAPQPRDVEARLQGGATLAPTTRERLERSFGRSFADVRVHTGAVAAAVTQDLRADALTVGAQVAFAPGQYRPGTAAGDHLIAHELAHVAQQGGSGGEVQTRSAISAGGDAAEAAAESAANRAVRGLPVKITPAPLNTRGRIMRRARLGAAPLPAMTVSAPLPGLGDGSGVRSAPSATMSGLVSPAGGRIGGAAPAVGAPQTSRRTAAEPTGPRAPTPTPPPAEPKLPEEAQTRIAEAAPSPPAVAVAGAPAGATGDEAGAGGPLSAAGLGAASDAAMAKKAGEAKAGGKEKEERLAAEETETKADAAAAEETLATVKGKKKRAFGQVPGDRGARAARAAAKRLDVRGGAMRTHEPAGKRVDEAQAAAEPPANEGAAKADHTKIGTFAAAEPPPPDAEAARAALLAAVENAAPATMEDMDDMAGRSASIGSTLAGTVGSQVTGVNQTLVGVKTPSEPATVPPAGEQRPGAPAPPTADPDLAAATPPPVPDSTLDASEFKDEAESALGEQDIDEETLAKSTEAPLAALANDKKELDTKVDAAAERARGTESTALTEAHDGLAADDAGANRFMATARGGREAEVVGAQDTARTTQETGRQSAADRIQTISNAAATTVGEKLDALTDTATKTFDEKQQGYLNTFTTNVQSELDAFKDDRYSGVFGWARWLKDKVVSINELEEVEALYRRNRDAYIENIKNLILEIVGQIDTTIADCKKTLETARAEIQGIIDQLPKDKQAEARKAQAAVEKRFNALERQVAQAAAQAFGALAERRKKAIADVDRALAEIKAENEALLDKIVNFVKRLIDLLGKFLKLLTRITRMGLGSFLSAGLGQAKDGVQNHLWGALQEAFKQWLFSKLPFVEPLLNLPPNWVEMLTAMAVSLPDLFMEHLPALLPAIGVAAMTWLAISLAAKLIPGAGAIMAIIDGIRAAIGLIQSLLSAADAFFAFVMKVADRAYAAVDFATALARGIVAAIGALLTFLGVDALIRRVAGAIAKPFAAIFARLKGLLKSRKNRKREAKAQERERERHEREKEPGGDDAASRSAKRRAEDNADRERRERNRRRDHETRRRAEGDRSAARGRRPDDPSTAKARQNERERDQARAREREARERLREAVARIKPQLQKLLSGKASRLLLRARLGVWKLRYRLSQLSIRGNRVTAVVNPQEDLSEIKAVDPHKLGAALQKVLAAAEATYLKERRESLPYAERRVVSSSKRELARGSEEPLGLGTPEAIELVREMFEGKVKVSPQERGKFFSAKVRPGEEGFLIYANVAKEKGAVPTGAGLYVHGAGSYPLQTPVAGAPSRRGLTQVVEPARSEGLYAAERVTDVLQRRAGTEEAKIYGADAPLGPMTVPQSAKAADIEAGRAPTPGPGQDRDLQEAARMHRHVALRNIFLTLAETLQNPKTDLVTASDAEATAIREVVEAFRTWVLANFGSTAKPIVDPNEARETALKLKLKLIAFLKTVGK